MNLFTWTGNPFVDNGIAAMLTLARKKGPEKLTSGDVQAMSERMLRIYLTAGWLKSMQNIFPNSAFTQPAYGANRPEKVREVIEFLEAEMKPLAHAGSCTCCGRREALRLPSNDKRKLPNNMILSKTYVPLNGGVMNFFPGGTYGADICATCVYAIQCAPLNFYTANTDEKRFVVVHSNSFRVLEAWSKEAKKKIDEQIATGNFSGCINEGYNNAPNAFFHIVQEIMSDQDFDDEDRFVSVRFYHFDNYNQPKSQPLKIYDLPTPAFRFLVKAFQHDTKDEWRKLIRRNYYFVKNSVLVRLPTMEESDEKTKTQKNFVLEKLLRDESITRYFFDRRRQEAFVSWKLLQVYLTEARGMSEPRIETIKKVADEIAIVIQQPSKKKRLAQLEIAPNYASFRNVLRYLIKDRKEMDAPEPLFTLDEYVEHLFPQGALGWKETQDLILFRLYETLHEWLKPEDLPQTDGEPVEGNEVDDSSTQEAA